MRARRLLVGCVAALVAMAGVGIALSPSRAADGDSPVKHTIKEVMKLAHGKDAGLLQKVLKGEASEAQKKELLDAYVSLVENTPTKGDEASWHQLAGKAALAAAKVVVGREGAVQELESATNCKACHSVHKGS